MRKYQFTYTTIGGKVHYLRVQADDFQQALDQLFGICPIAKVMSWVILDPAS